MKKHQLTKYEKMSKYQRLFVDIKNTFCLMLKRSLFWDTFIVSYSNIYGV